MAIKKTVVQMYEEILALCETDEQKAFIEKRIEITKKKNAQASDGELTPKQKEQAEAEATLLNEIVDAMVEGVEYTATDLVKLMAREDIASTQKMTPRLTALVKADRIVKAVVKGRSVYSLPSTEGDTDTE